MERISFGECFTIEIPYPKYIFLNIYVCFRTNQLFVKMADESGERFVIRVRGLPWETNEQQVFDFFKVLN